MLTATLLAILAAAARGVVANSTDATEVNNNPVGDTYIATLPYKAFDADAYPNGTNAKGSIMAAANTNRTGVRFRISFSNLPSSGGPFTYHIHASPVPSDGNCTAAGSHLDPFMRGEDPSCDSSSPQTCQVGDLSGKHGKITSDPFTDEYTDLYASTDANNAAFFGNLSFVLHYPNKTRITCANFQLSNGTTSSNSSRSSGNANISAAPAGALPRAVAFSAALAALLAAVMTFML